MVNIREVKNLIQLMNENDLTEIEVEFEGGKIKLKKGPDGVVYREPATSIVMPAASQAQVGVAPPVAAEPVGQSIKSPMVGTFYASPSPDSDAFVSVGAKVEVGQVVCIVEAMKLMNEIKSEIKGTITELRAKDGEPVEFGQPLFLVS
ncbi:MAG: acetyl-CoA carboxylase biotin carboxyl carrier protein [Candidatus Omnitrophota bacterium]|jgi:acetyl-CoA carboxylase biotin carboxyl carrier protein